MFITHFPFHRRVLNYISDCFFAKRIGSEAIIATENGKVKGWEIRVVILEMKRDEFNQRVYLAEYDDGFQDWIWEDELL